MFNVFIAAFISFISISKSSSFKDPFIKGIKISFNKPSMAVVRARFLIS